jgi:O-antigen/teichoic acid export membrane protein
LLPRAAPLVAGALLGLVIYNADLISLRFFRDASTVGHYAAAYTLISFLSNLGVAYSMSLLPGLTRLGSAPRERDALYHAANAQVFAACFPIAVGGTLLAPAIVDLVFGRQYGPSAVALAILIWVVPLALLRDMPIMALIARGREDRVLRATALAAAFSLALNLLLIPPFGLVGAATASVLTEAARMTLALVQLRAEGGALTGLARFWRPAFAGAVMAGLLLAQRAPAVWLAVPLGAASYVAALTMVGGIKFRRGALPFLDV